MPWLFAAAVVLSVGCLATYGYINEECKKVSEEIEKCKQELATEEKNYLREKARWDGKLSPENFERTLRDHGLLMVFPTASQIVRIGADGRMIPKQPSEARAKRVLVPRASSTSREPPHS